MFLSVPPTNPESISLKDNTVSLTERNTATFICKGNVGNPPGKFIWQKKRRGVIVPDVYTNMKTNHTKVEESCSYIGIAELTLTLTETDNQAVVGCAEESLMNNETMFKFTPPIDVYCK